MAATPLKDQLEALAKDLEDEERAIDVKIVRNAIAGLQIEYLRGEFNAITHGIPVNKLEGAFNTLTPGINWRGAGRPSMRDYYAGASDWYKGVRRVKADDLRKALARC